MPSYLRSSIKQGYAAGEVLVAPFGQVFTTSPSSLNARDALYGFSGNVTIYTQALRTRPPPTTLLPSRDSLAIAHRSPPAASFAAGVTSSMTLCSR